MSIYDDIWAKCKTEELFATNEREKLQNLLIDKYTEWITRIDDEALKEEAYDIGCIL